MTTVTSPMASTLSYNKICNVEDFAHPDLQTELRRVFAHEIDRFGPQFPLGHEYRKQWEVAMAVRTFRDHGLLDASHELLGVGAGNEPTIFYLTRFVRRVFATDLYLDPGSWGEVTDFTMLTEPERHWPFPWNPRRLVVQHMDAMDLRYEDDSFDAVFSSSSIEHFGDFEAIGRSLDEVYRVLRPGGIFSVATEFLIEGPTLGNPGLVLFDGPAIFHYLVSTRGWLPLSPVDLRVSEETLSGSREGARYNDDLTRQQRAQGGYFTFKLEFDRYPQLVLHHDYWRWVSVHLALRKPEREAVPAPASSASVHVREPSRAPAPLPAGTLSYNKVCNLEDFAHPQLRAVIREVFAHERSRFGPDFPTGHEYRKYWEVAMAVRSFADFGLLDGRSELLGIGAGNEPTIFHLTRFARRVFATDRYLTSDNWDASANASMLAEPDRHWPFAWNPRRLVVQHMDALDLRYEDESIDGVFSCSSLEHFGDLDGVRRSVAEMHRVLKPGGVLALSTEYLIDGPAPGFVGCWMFTVPLLYETLFDPCAWELASPIDFSVSGATLRTEQDFTAAAQFQDAQADRHGAHSTFKIEHLQYPHLVLRMGDFVFTSIHLTLRKA